MSVIDIKREANLASESEYCALAGITKGSVRNQRCRGDGPPFVRVGRNVFYPLDELHKYLAGRLVRPSKAPSMIHGKRARR